MSNIDPSNPTEGQATTQSVRDNFQAAANEIDANAAAAAAAQAAADAAQAKADSSVQLTGAQSIAGQKTFTDNAIFGLIEASDITLNKGDTNWNVNFGSSANQIGYSAGANPAYFNGSLGVNLQASGVTRLFVNGNGAVFSVVPSTSAAQGTAAEALTRKDYVDQAIADAIATSSGSFTPEFWDETLGVNQGTYSSQTGRWIRQGDLVTISVDLKLSSLGSLPPASSVRLGNLPFAGAASWNTTLSVGYWDTLATPKIFLSGYLATGAFTVTGTGSALPNTQSLLFSEAGGNFRMLASATYKTDDA